MSLLKMDPSAESFGNHCLIGKGCCHFQTPLPSLPPQWSLITLGFYYCESCKAQGDHRSHMILDDTLLGAAMPQAACPPVCNLNHAAWKNAPGAVLPQCSLASVMSSNCAERGSAGAMPGAFLDVACSQESSLTAPRKVLVVDSACPLSIPQHG